METLFHWPHFYLRTTRFLYLTSFADFACFANFVYRTVLSSFPASYAFRKCSQSFAYRYPNLYGIRSLSGLRPSLRPAGRETDACADVMPSGISRRFTPCASQHTSGAGGTSTARESTKGFVPLRCDMAMLSSSARTIRQRRSRIVRSCWRHAQACVVPVRSLRSASPIGARWRVRVRRRRAWPY